MRICHIISGDLWAGAEVMTYRLLNCLNHYEDLELSVILFNEGKLADELRCLNIPIYVLDENQLNFIQIVRRTRNIVKKISPNVIHSHRYKENILACLSVKSFDGRISLVSTQHGLPEPVQFTYKKVKHAILSNFNLFLLKHRFNYVVAVSEDIKRNLIELFRLPEEKIVVILNGTDLRKDFPCEKGVESFVVGSAGRLFPVKNYSFMVEVAQKVLDSDPSVRFELAGEGPEIDKIFELTKRSGIERSFILKGFVPDMESFYKNLHLFINTSLHEGIPMTILEAMAHGLPVVAPDIGGLAEIVDNGVQGYLIENNNAMHFADKILEIKRDRDLFTSMASASIEKIREKFTSEVMTEKYYQLYTEAEK